MRWNQTDICSLIHGKQRELHGTTASLPHSKIFEILFSPKMYIEVVAHMSIT